MSEFPPHVKLLKEAREKEASFAWVEATDYYESAILALVEKVEYLKAGETQERAAYCLYRAAYQSENQEEFTRLLLLASEDYRKAASIFEIADSTIGAAKILSSETMAFYYQSWTIAEPSDRKDKIEECLQRAEQALVEWNKTGDTIRYCKTGNDLLTILYSISELSFNWMEGKAIIEKALDYGEKIIGLLLETEEEYELARTYYLLSMILSDRPMDVFDSIEKQHDLQNRGMEYSKKALEYSEKIGDPFLIGMSHGILSYYTVEITEDLDTAIDLAQKQLELGKKTSDHLMQARAHDYLSYHFDWKADIHEDPEIIKTEATNAITSAEEAINHYRIVLNPIVIAFIAQNQSYHKLAMLETELDKRLFYEKRGLDESYQHLEYARNLGSLLGEMYLSYMIGSSLRSMARLEREPTRRKDLLIEALKNVNETSEYAEEAQPFRYWALGVTHNNSARIQSQLARLEDDDDVKKGFYLSAIENTEKGIELSKTHIELYDLPGYHQQLAVVQQKFGEILEQTYLFTNEKTYLDRAVHTYNDAIEFYRKEGFLSETALIQWRIAWLYYRLHNYQRAATEFNLSSMNYRGAAGKFPNHEDFFTEYATYMEAWSNISKAMHHHSRQQYLSEKECFDRTVDIYQSSERWSYLSDNYQAWARLSEAENSSRNEQTVKARALFLETSELFFNAKRSIEDKIRSIGDNDEAEMANELISASDLRREYCLGRMKLEEAKLHDKRGEYLASSEKYASAGAMFEKISSSMERKSDQQELSPIITLCRGWQKMTEAEAYASPELFNEASTFFEEAKEKSLNEKTGLLALGHASFCRALEVGTRYEVTKEGGLYQELIRHLNSSTNYYVRAGFESALDYSKATQRMFEAYLYIDNAIMDSDPERKVRYYSMAEKVLESSAELFLRSDHVEKRGEVLRFLASIREERELATSLSQLLHAPSISSSTMSFNVPTPTHENAVGHQRFDDADLRAKILVKFEEFSSGEDFELLIEVFNAGSVSASLVRVEDLIPEDFQVSEVSGFYKYADEVLDMKGKMVGPLNTIEIPLKIKPMSRGEYTLKPRIVYLNNDSEYRSCEPEPVQVKITEMGILSWLRGTR